MSLRLLKRPIAAASAVALGLGMLIGVSGLTASHAADNPQITVTPTALVRYDPNGTVIDGPIPLNEIALMKFKWDAVNANPKSGDSFTVNFGEYFRSRVPGGTFPMKIAGKTAATCRVAAESFTCTFTPELDELKVTHPNGINGKGSIQLVAHQETDARTVPMNFNGTAVDVPLPGPEGGIKGRGPSSFKLDPFKKYSTGMSESSTAANWYISFSIDELNKKRAEQGLPPIPTDGTPTTILLEDSLGPKMQFKDIADGQQITLSAATADEKKELVALRTVKPVTTPGWSLTYDKNAAGSYASLGITGPFRAATNYTIFMPTAIVGKAQPGFEYSNSVKIDGMDLVSETSRTFTESFAIDIEMLPGFGEFNILKSLSGNGSGLVDPSATYRVTAKYRFPNDRTVDDFAINGQPYRYPGKLDADRKGGSVVLALSPGKKAYPEGQLPGEAAASVATLPINTTVTLEEDAASLPAIDGVQWQAPEFKVGNDVTNTFTIKDQVDQNVTLTNRALLTTKQFSVKKTVQGVPAGVITEPFVFKYVCDSGIAGRVTVPGDGQVHLVDAQVPAKDNCVISEEPGKTPVPGFVVVDVPAPVTLDMASSNTTAEFTNVYTPAGQVVVTKTVEGIDEGEVAGKAFPFTLECTAGAKTFTEKGAVKLDANWTSKMLPVGAQCTVTEDTDAAAVSGYNLTIAPKQVSIESGKPTVNVVLNNVYSEKVGSIEVTKTANGLASDAERDNKTFPVSVSCLLSDDKVLQLKHGQPQTIENLRAGDICTISEDKAGAEIDGYTLADPVIDNAKITVEEGQTHRVNVTNTYTRDMGSLVISKNVVAPADAVFDGKEFTIAYSCGQGTDAKTGEVKLTHGQSSAPIADIPAGTQCTVTEAEHKVEGYTHAVAIDQPVVTIARNETANVAITNTYTRDLGSLVITKNVVAPADKVFEGKEFTISYTCGAPASPVKMGEVTLAHGQTSTPITDIPSGTECVVNESQDSAFLKGYANTVSYDNARVVIEKDQQASVTVTNEYTALKGSFVLSKTVAGDGQEKAKDATFAFTYECTDLQGASLGKKTVDVPAGKSVSIETRPGTCVVEEQAAPIDHTQHSVSFTVDGVPSADKKVEITIPEDQNAEPVAVGAVNTYTLDRGIFTVAKTATGLPEEAKDKEFVFDYSCVGGVEGQVTVKADGVPVQAGNSMPVGTECTFSENAVSAQLEGFNVVIPEPKKGIINVADEVVALDFVNAYTKKPVTPDQDDPKSGGVDQQPKPDQPKTDGVDTVPGKDASTKVQTPVQQPSSKIASTGSTAMNVAGIAALILAIGAAATWLVRRQV